MSNPVAKRNTRSELDFITALIIFNQWKTCVETGVARGDGSKAICRAVTKTDGHLYGFDIWARHGLGRQYPQMGGMKEVHNKLQRAGILRKRYTLTQIDLFQQNEFEKKLDELCPNGIDFAFIDACHSYAGIKNDFSIIYPRLTKFGAIVFHDTLFVDGCREFILDLRTKYNDGSFDIVDFPHGGKKRKVFGISLLMKRSTPVSDIPISQICGSPSTPQEIELREVKWYQSELLRHKNNMKRINDSVKIDPNSIRKSLKCRAKFDK